MKRKLMISIIFIVGLSVFTYPIISNWFSSKEHYKVISNHNKVLAKMTEEEKELEKKKAAKYNESLDGSAIPFEDPFSEQNSESEHTGYYNVLDVGETIGAIEIPGIDVELPIFHGIGDDVLQQGVGHMSNSSFPVGGKGTHSALTAHRGLPSSKLFRNLDKVEMDDVFYVKTLNETLAYEVDDIQIVLPHEVDWLEINKDHDYVTLITCEPYMINTHRLLVRGERIPYEEEMHVVEQASSPLVYDDSNRSSTPFILIGVSLFVILLMIILIVYKKRQQQHGG